MERQEALQVVVGADDKLALERLAEPYMVPVSTYVEWVIDAHLAWEDRVSYEIEDQEAVHA